MKTYGISVDALTLPRYTGVERYVFSLLKAMMQEPLYKDERVILYSSKPILALGDLPYGWSYKILNWSGKGWTHFRLGFELVFHPPTVFVALAHEVPLLHRQSKIVGTIHDLAFLITPSVYSLWARWRQRLALGHTLNDAAAIITVSQTTKNDIAKRFSHCADKMTAVPLAIDCQDFSISSPEIEAVLKAYGLKRGEYFVAVGRIEKKKNHLLLIKAFEFYKEKTGSKVRLLFLGSFGYGASEIQNRIQTSFVGQDILTPGFVSDVHKAALLAGATALLFASTYEGFGLPLLEAMAVGTPIICSDIPSSHEVVQDAAIFCEVKDSRQWALALERIEQDKELVRVLNTAGKKRLGDFNWRSSARKTFKVLRSV